MSIRAVNLGFAYGGAAPIFEKLSFHLERGWTALVGPNGAGKSTLLDLVRGAREPTAGDIHTEPPEPVAWCPQRVDDLEDSIEEFANAWTPEALKWMSRFELEWADLERWLTLSPGERKRWQVAAALYRRPAFLVLDEPTNHLDADGRRALRHALAGFDGVGLVVSHDREFIDDLCDRVLWLERGELSAYRGSWDEVRQARAAERQAALDQLERAQAKVRKLERLQSKRRAEAANADRGISARTRMTSRNDSDGRSMAAKGRAENAAASASASAGALAGRIEQARESAAAAELGQSFGGELTVDGFASRQVLGAWSIDEVRAPDDRVLIRDVALRVSPGDRVAITGPNGAGKSTLLRALDEGIAPSVASLLVPQEWSPEEAAQIRASVLARPSEELGQILAFVATLGVDPEHLLRSQRWSPGELRKASFATVFALGRVELMLLDEPTNHLDIPSQERLEAALEQWPGAVVFVSHDAWFADSVATDDFEISAATFVRR